MRILHILDHSIPLHSGYTFRTAAILAEQRRRGWDTHQLTTPKHTAPGSSIETVDGLTFYRTPWDERHRPPVLNELAIVRAVRQRLDEVIESVRPDILHAHSPALNALATWRAAQKHRLPWVYEIRSFWEDAAVEHGTTTFNSPRYRATRALETFCSMRADAVFTICNGLLRDLAERGLPESRLSLIPNSVEPSDFRIRPRDEPLARELGIGGAFVIGFVGSFYSYEGLELLVDAADRLRDHPRPFRVLLVGGGPCDEALRKQVARRGLGSQVLFTGRIPHSEVNRYYSLIDSVVLPRQRTRLTDLTTPLKPLEAYALRKPVIASDIGGHRELVVDERTGLLFPADSVDGLVERVLRIERDPSLRDRLVTAAHAYMQAERTWEASVARYEPVYRRLLAA
jgi:glycogen(starch) synthase